MAALVNAGFRSPTFLGFAQRADRHRAAGAGYGAIRRSLEYLETFPPAAPEELQRAVADIQNRMDALAESAPEVPDGMKRLIDDELESGHHRRIIELPARSTVNGKAGDNAV